ncbi:MAG TPA: M20 family metallo-hydrolase [Ktedonobacteraceae bacterium]|jgi:allantoate deiminase|nr:M20 family metallo-hydrolase [Ktedonobacteraceae bacterium]
MTQPINNIKVDASTLQYYIDALGAIGQQPAGGIVRPVYSPAWLEARQQLATFMHAAGLQVREDAVGNLFGRLAGTDDSHTILTGSHFDTVPLGGKFDGALGILAGIAALQALREHLGTPRRSLEVVALCEEEGSRFPAHCWGTKAILGRIDPAEFEVVRDAQDITIAEAMRAIGLAPERYREAIRTDLAAFLELHIEQGRILFDEGMNLGIVTAITGLQHFWITVKGRADHAGTTPMDLRQDALQAAAHMALEVTHLVEQAGRPAVVTMGKWEVKPGAINVVPGEVSFSVDLRHPEEETLQQLSAAIRTQCESIAQARHLSISMELTGRSLPQKMDPGLQATLVKAAGACGATWKSLPSGAGHDSQIMARHLPTAMLFVPSVEGRSHSPAEYTTIDDAARGASVLATALSLLAY